MHYIFSSFIFSSFDSLDNDDNIMSVKNILIYNKVKFRSVSSLYSSIAASLSLTLSLSVVHSFSLIAIGFNDFPPRQTAQSPKYYVNTQKSSIKVKVKMVCLASLFVVNENH